MTQTRPCTFALDSFAPTVLRCRRCGQGVALVEATDAEDLRELSPAQCAQRWPGVASAVLAHDLVCSWRENGRG